MPTLHDAARRNDVTTVVALIAAGARVDATNQNGETALHIAARRGHAELAKTLVDAGACVDPIDEDWYTPLHQAVQHDAVETIMVLLAAGASLDATDMHGNTPLLMAVQASQAETVKALIDAGATLNGTNKLALHVALASGNSVAVQVLLAAGAPIDEVDNNGCTALLITAGLHTSDEFIPMLVAAGANVNAADKNGETALHKASLKNSRDGIKALIDAGARVDTTDKGGSSPLHTAVEGNATDAIELLVAAGGPLDTVDERGYTPLHTAAVLGHIEATRLLVDAGADVNSVDKSNWTPLCTTMSKQHYFDEQAEARLEMLKCLIGRGASLPSSEGTRVDGLWEAAVCWTEQRHRGQELTSLPVEVYERGPEDIRAYFKSLAAVPPARQDESSDLDYRSKVCVVGPSTWGKTSFIKSFTGGKATLEEADTRTVGIDLFSWSFGTTDHQRYNVTLWDFAGQDEYQSAHSLFFTRRTLYVQCINLKAYADTLNASQEDDDDMNQFVETNIIKWIRVICAHYPTACFVFVGTKADLIDHDTQVVRAIGSDLMRRLRRNEQAIVDALERELSELHLEQQQSESRGDPNDSVRPRIKTLEALKSQRPRILSSELLVVSSADLSGMPQVKERLEEYIAQSGTGFLMPPIYSQLYEHLHLKAKQAIDDYHTNGDVSSLVDNTFVSVDVLYTRAKESPVFEAVTIEELTAMLHVLHDLGDVLWFDHDPESSLTRTVFLSPSIVIDFVRCIINHTLGKPEHAKTKLEKELYPLIQTEGRVKHKLIERLAMWRDVSCETMLQLKELLWLFQLAYPHTSDGMKWDSDLVIPLYWKREGEVRSLPVAAMCLHWEYIFRVYLPENLFEKYCVQNYAISASCDRQHTRDWYSLSREGTSEVLVHKHVVSIEGDRFLAVAISVRAPSTEMAWQELVMFCMSMERLLEGYPGLWVSRSVVSARGRRYDVDELVRERMEQERAGVRSGNAPSIVTSTLLPSDMSWYTQRCWRERAFARVVISPDESVLRQLRDNMQRMVDGQERLQLAQDRIETKISTGFEEAAAAEMQTRNALMNMFAGATNRRLFPALWTLEAEHHTTTATMTLRIRIRSDLTGLCYHDPLCVTVGNATIARYGGCIQAGLSFFSCVVPDFFGKGVIDAIATECQRHIDQTVAVHNLIGGLQLPHGAQVGVAEAQKLPPDSTLALFVDLLRIVCSERGKEFDPLHMTELSGLECGYLPATGDYVWAHRDEISQRSADIFLAHKAINSTAVSNGRDEHSKQPQHDGEQPAPLPPLQSTPLPPLQSTPLDHAQEPSQPEYLSLRIVEVKELRKGRSIGRQCPFCRWTITCGVGGVIASGQTQVHQHGGTNPNWSSQAFPMRLPPRSSLHNVLLVVTVKCAGVIAVMETTLGDGSLDLSHLFVEGKFLKGTPNVQQDIRLVWKGALAGVMTIALE